MGSSLNPFKLKDPNLLLIFFLCFPFTVINVSSFSKPPLCHDDESLALLDLKQSFTLNEVTSPDPFAYPKTSSWKPAENKDCCLWDGIECDENTGHVIGLDLSSSFLYGSVNSNSTLFRLDHLQKLNLAYNDFNYSQIPSTIGHLSNLSYLNLSDASFSGQIPLEISTLSKLTTLDLSYSYDYSYPSLLQLENPTLNSMLQNLTNLKVLWLTGVNISTTMPNVWANLSSLTSLQMSYCGLQGEFPATIFHLPNIKVLSLQCNPDLTGNLPEFNKSSRLVLLRLYETSFFGKIPDSIGNLNFLSDLDISSSDISGWIPPSLGNLTQLEFLDLSFTKLKFKNWQWLGKQSKLTFLGLAKLNLTGHIPLSLQNLTRIECLLLRQNKLTGQIPFWIGNLSKITTLELEENNFQGSIPQSFYSLVNLQELTLSGNNRTGTVELEMFLSLKYLTELLLSYMNLSFITNNNSGNATCQKFFFLELRNCNLKEFPSFLQHQDELGVLDLTGNGIRGPIPKWFWNISTHTLAVLLLSDNFLIGQLPPVLLWTNLLVLDLSRNRLDGSLPIPPLSTFEYVVDQNSLTGEVSPLFCNLSSLKLLNLSYNKLSGNIPQCLAKSSTTLLDLNLQNNKFCGTIPPVCSVDSNLVMIDLSKNLLEGLGPRSLVNCKRLEFLNIGNNQIVDRFPSWFGTLPELRVLILGHNRFYGAIADPKEKLNFPQLHVIDLSHNEFTGKLPSKYFDSWTAMKVMNASHHAYLLENHNYKVNKTSSIHFAGNHLYSMTITNKGTQAFYSRIPENLLLIDLSSNLFEGGIPELMGNMQGIQLLNLSNNSLTGPIPSSLWNLTNIEALDLSQNKLSGEIPQQLAELSFLEIFNVSYNHLTGPIPHGTQFDTFDNTSFEGNPGLCGAPLSKKCSTPLSTADVNKDEDSKFPSRYDWIFILAGCISGFVVGLVMGHTLTTKKHEWFVKTFGRRPGKRQRRRIIRHQF